jgi:hypothetical protein
MQRGQVGQLAKRRFDLRIEPDGAGEPVTSVNDSVAHRVGARHPRQRVAERAGVDLAALQGKIRGCEHVVTGVEHSELEAGRPGVHR